MRQVHPLAQAGPGILPEEEIRAEAIEPPVEVLRPLSVDPEAEPLPPPYPRPPNIDGVPYCYETPIPLPRPTTTILSGVRVTSRGTVIGIGNVYLADVIEGIENWTTAPRDVFKNRGNPLPPQEDELYYLEFYKATPGFQGTGPERIIRGLGGELFYTPDHYQTFTPLRF
jgi:hypothetical protein